MTTSSRRSGAVPSRLLVLVTAVLALLVPGAPAWAHARLVSADPAPGATLTTAPAAVTLVFTEKLNPGFTTIVVSDSARQRVAASAPVVDGAAGTIGLDRSLGNGVYTVAYRVVSNDGHTVQGSHTFTVADPAQPAAVDAVRPAPGPAGAAAPPAGAGGIPVPVMIGVGVLGAVLAAVAAYLHVTGRRRAAGPDGP